MKVCIVSKFPPIQGGIASRTYWLARGLAETGVEVHVVTNALAVEDDYRIKIEGDDYKLPAGVFIHNTDPDTPWHIPSSPIYQEKLLDKVLEVYSKHNIDVIDSHYFVPYGITAFLASKIIGIPYIIRHGGSDIAKFWERGSLRQVLEKTLRDASTIVSETEHFSCFNSNVVNIPRYVPDERVFKPKTREKPNKTFAYIGKINYHWQHKSLKQIIDFWSENGTKAKLVFLAQGKGKENFIKEYHQNNIIFSDFIPPWEMPTFLQNIDYLLCLVNSNPILDFSNVVAEAVACGVKVLTDNIASFDCYNSFFNVKKNVYPISNFGFINLNSEMNQDNPPIKSYVEYIHDNLKLYSNVINSH